MKKMYCFCISLLLLSASHAQNASGFADLKNLANKADQLPYTSDSLQIQSDSILVDIKGNPEKIHSVSTFTISRRKIIIDYYSSNYTLRYIRVQEKTAADPERDCLHEYYFDKNRLTRAEHKVVDQNAKTYSRACLDKDYLAFLDHYILKLYFDIYTRQAPARLEMAEPD